MTTTTTRSGAEEKQNPGQLNSVQLNIVTLIDMEKATESGSLAGSMYMMTTASAESARARTSCRRSASRARC